MRRLLRRGCTSPDYASANMSANSVQLQPVDWVDRRRGLRRVSQLLAACAAVASVSCGGSGPSVACTDELRAVIQVDVIDSITGKPAAAGTTVLLRGTTRDSIAVPSTPDTVLTAHVWYENIVKAGTYSVTVSKAGYSEWVRSGISVQADACHVTTHEVLTAKLQARTPR